MSSAPESSLPPSLPQVPDAALFARLQRAVEFLQHALSHAAVDAPVDRMVAVHGLDNAVEFLLRIVLDHFDVEGRTGKTLSTMELSALAGEVNKFLSDAFGIQLPYQTELKKLRQLRNMVQHGMVDPVSEMTSLQRMVERFYSYVFTRLFGLDPSQLRLSSLIRDAHVRLLLAAAEDAIAGGKPLEAVIACRDAFENAYYERRRLSDLRIDAIPAALEAPSVQATYFYRTVVEELEHVRVGLDLRLYDRFAEYLSHIPHYRRLDGRGARVMERPWAREDAEFCYRFVSNTLLRWQESDFGPLYERESPEPVDWVESFGPAVTPADSHLMSYHGDSFDLTPDIDVFVLPPEAKAAFEALPLGVEMDHRTIVSRNGELETRMFNRVVLRDRRSRLLTHNPPRWEVVLRHDWVPFTWCRQDAADGLVLTETICINTATAKEIEAMDPDEFPPPVAEAIVVARETHGRLAQREDLAIIPDLTDMQRYWLFRFTPAEPASPFAEGVGDRVERMPVPEPAQ